MTSLREHRHTLLLCLVLSLQLLLLSYAIFHDSSVSAGWRRQDDSDQTDEQTTTTTETTTTTTTMPEGKTDQEKAEETKNRAMQGGGIGVVSAVAAKIVNDKYNNRKRRREPEQVMVAGPVTQEAVELARKAEETKLTPESDRTISRIIDAYKDQQPKDEIDLVTDALARRAKEEGYKEGYGDDKHFRNALKNEAKQKRDECEKGRLVHCPGCGEGVPMKDLETVRIRGQGPEQLIVGASQYDDSRVIHRGCSNPFRETAGDRVSSLFSLTPRESTGIPISKLLPEWESYKIKIGAPSPVTHIKCVNPNCPEKYVPRNDLEHPSFFSLDSRVTCPGCSTKQHEPPMGSYRGQKESLTETLERVLQREYRGRDGD